MSKPDASHLGESGNRHCSGSPVAAILSCLRAPQQERGERRVCAILDAAAELIAEVGPGGLTVQSLADRARTSKGSLYHFFPDLASVLRALGDRHMAAISALTQQMIADPGVAWETLDLADVVDRFIAPLAYLESHPDLLALARTPLLVDRKTRGIAPLRDLAEHILGRRYPALQARERLVRAATMVAMVDGIVGYGLRSDDVDSGEMTVELRQVFGAYLATLELAAPLATSGR